MKHFISLVTGQLTGDGLESQSSSTLQILGHHATEHCWGQAWREAPNIERGRIKRRRPLYNAMTLFCFEFKDSKNC